MAMARLDQTHHPRDRDGAPPGILRSTCRFANFDQFSRELDPGARQCPALGEIDLMEDFLYAGACAR